MIGLLLVLLLLAPGLASPLNERQPGQFPSDLRPQLDRLRQAALESDWAFQRLAHLCNKIGPRLSGTPQAERAVEYVAGEMRALGLEVTLEECLVTRWVRGVERAGLVEYPDRPTGVEQQLALTALGGSPPTPEQGITAEIVVVHELDEIDRVPVRGRMVLVDHPYDDQLAALGEGGMAYGQCARIRVDGPARAARNGAVACLVRSLGGVSYRLPHTGVLDWEDGPQIPAAAVSEEDAELIASLAREGPVRLRLRLGCRELAPVKSHNVIADLKGSEIPEQVVIVSGHLDSWDLGTGALDDGAGVVMAMQTAHLIKKLGLQPRRTLRVIAWMNEENGTAGSKAYFANHEKDLANHFAAIESDLGCGHPYGFGYQGDPKLAAVLAPIAEALRPMGAGAMRQLPGTGADISPLTRRGVPGFHPLLDSRTYFDYHHTAADTLDKVNPRFLQENCAVMAVLAYALTRL